MIFSNRIGALILIAGSGLVGCASSTEQFFEYEKVSVKTPNGFVSVTLNPTRKEIVVDGERVVVWSSPYRLSTQFTSMASVVSFGELQNLVVTDSQSGGVLQTESKVIDSARKFGHYETGRSVMLVGFGVDLGEIPYVDYQVSFDFQVFQPTGELFDEGQIAVVVPPNFYTGRRPKTALRPR